MSPSDEPQVLVVPPDRDDEIAGALAVIGHELRAWVSRDGIRRWCEPRHGTATGLRPHAATIAA